MGEVYFDFPHDQWFQVSMEFDIGTGIPGATWKLWIDGISIFTPVPVLPLTNSIGTRPKSLGGLNFSSGSQENLFYIDNIWYIEPIFDIDDNQRKQFALAPNPAQDIVSISSNGEILNKTIIYSISGTVITTKEQNTDAIDLSNLPNGIYFLELYSNSSKEVHKIIKQ